MDAIGSTGSNARNLASRTRREGTRDHEAASSLYEECWRCFVTPKAGRLHVLEQPSMDCGSVLYAAIDEPGLCDDVAAMTGERPKEADAIVVLGREVLEGDLSVDEMAEAALYDVAAHLNRIWPVSGGPAGEAAYVSVLVASHRVFQEGGFMDPVIARIGERFRGLCEGHVARAIDGMVRDAVDSKGGWMDLPASPKETWQAAKEAFVAGMDRADQPLAVG